MSVSEHSYEVARHVNSRGRVTFQARCSCGWKHYWRDRRWIAEEDGHYHAEDAVAEEAYAASEGAS